MSSRYVSNAFWWSRSTVSGIIRYSMLPSERNSFLWHEYNSNRNEISQWRQSIDVKLREKSLLNGLSLTSLHFNLRFCNNGERNHSITCNAVSSIKKIHLTPQVDICQLDRAEWFKCPKILQTALPLCFSHDVRIDLIFNCNARFTLVLQYTRTINIWQQIRTAFDLYIKFGGIFNMLTFLRSQ